MIKMQEERKEKNKNNNTFTFIQFYVKLRS